MGVTSATLALVVASTAVVAAHPGDRGDHRDRGFGGPRMERFGGSLRDAVRAGLHGRLDAFIRQETTFERGEDGIVTRRVDNGTVDAVTEGTLDYSLATGEAASVTIDEETQALTFTETAFGEGRRGFRGRRMMATLIEPAAVEAGSHVVVWSEAGEDGTFVAHRIVVQPEVEATTDADHGEAGDGADGAETDAASAVAAA